MIKEKPAEVSKLFPKSDWDDKAQFEALSSELTRHEISEYISDMLDELKDLAKSCGLRTLNAILEIAAREARRDPAIADNLVRNADQDPAN